MLSFVYFIRRYIEPVFTKYLRIYKNQNWIDNFALVMALYFNM